MVEQNWGVGMRGEIMYKKHVKEIKLKERDLKV